MKQHASMRFMKEGEDLIPTRKSLLGRLKNWDDNDSWRAFFETYWRLIYRFAVLGGLNHQEAEDVVQDTVLAVAKGIGRFDYDPGKCAFKTWLLTVTRSKMANQFEKRARQEARNAPMDESGAREVSIRPIETHAPDEWEEAWDREWKQNLMDAAIQRVKDRVSIEHFQMFDLFVLKGWEAREVARTLQVTVAHVYVAKHRISKLVRQHYAAIEENAALELSQRVLGQRTNSLPTRNPEPRGTQPN